MKIHSGISFGGISYGAGDEVEWHKIYPVFLFHVLVIGSALFYTAYSGKGPPAVFLVLGGISSAAIYTLLYLAVFGFDEIKWMFINAGLGILGIFSQLDFAVSFFGWKLNKYPWYIHIVPFLHYILYTFLVRQMILDILKAREDESKRRKADGIYVLISLVIYSGLYFFDIIRGDRL